MYSIIQKIYEKNNKILKEGLKKVLSGEDVSSLTVCDKRIYRCFRKRIICRNSKTIR